MLCPDYGKEVSKESLVAHHQIEHAVKNASLGQEVDEVAEGENPSNYRMSFAGHSGQPSCGKTSI